MTAEAVRSISQPFLRRPVFTIVCSLLVLLAGVVSLVGLGLEDLPQLAPTRVSVRASFPAASPAINGKVRPKPCCAPAVIIRDDDN